MQELRSRCSGTTVAGGDGVDAREEIGQRIAQAARRRRGLSQAVLVRARRPFRELARQVERGQRSVDSHSVINALAEIVGLAADELTVKKTTR